MVDSLHPPCMYLMRQNPAVHKNYVKYVFFLIRLVWQIIHEKSNIEEIIELICNLIIIISYQKKTFCYIMTIDNYNEFERKN